MAGLTQKVAAAEQAQLRCRELENALRELRAQLKEAQEEAATLKVWGGGVTPCPQEQLAWQAGWLAAGWLLACQAGRQPSVGAGHTALGKPRMLPPWST